MTKCFFKKDKIYYNIFFRFTLIIFIITMSLSSILYFQFQNILKSELYTSEQLKLQQASYSANLLTNYVRALAKQVYYDRDINPLRVYDSLNYKEETAGLTQLQHYKSMNDIVLSIYVYNSKSEKIYIADGDGFKSIPSTFDKGLSTMLENYSLYGSLNPIPRMIPITTIYDDTIYLNGYTLFFYENPGNNKPLSNAVIVNISEEWMQKTTGELNRSKQSNVFIINNEGKLLNNTSDYAMFYNLSEQDYIKTILSSLNDQGYFIQNINNVKSLVVYSYFKQFDWIYVSIIPYENILNNVNKVRFIVVLIAFALLIFGLIISFYQTRQVYHPLELALDQNKIKHSTKLIQRNNLLKTLLFDRNILKNELLVKELGDLGFNVKEHTNYFMILFTIDQYDAFFQKNKIEDRKLYTFSIANISNEIIGQYFKNDYIDLDNNTVILIISIDTASIDADILNDGIKKIQTVIQECFELSITATVSSTSDTLANLPLLYNEVLALSNYKFYLGYQSIISHDDITEKNSDEFNYSVELEQQFIESLITNNISKAKLLFNNMIESASNNSYVTLKLTINHFAFALNSAIVKIEKNTGISLQSDLYEFVNTVSTLETLDETLDAFNYIFNDLEEKLKSRDNDKYEKIVTEIIKKIEIDYANIDLSVSYLAEYVDLSAPYLGRIFKQITGKGLPDYINDIRLMKAEELLTSSKLPIKDIIEKTGFTSSQYFHRLFKKKHVITPNQYRKNK